MNCVRIMGGLGNQLFQYAFGKVHEKHGHQVVYDLSWYNKQRKWPRPFLLDRFNTTMDVKQIDSHTLNGYLNENGHIDFGVFQKDNYYFDGYWQYRDYYVGILNELREDVTLHRYNLPAEFYYVEKEIKRFNSIGVHVRRGDYLEQKNWGVQSFEYYYKAIHQLLSDMNGEIKIFVFSDDIEWCKQRITEQYFKIPIIFVQLEPHLDFELLKQCKNIVMSSSTFSWWASFLNENKNKKIVAPSRWLGETIDPYIYHYPTNWIKI